MKTERRHELQTNTLALWLEHKIEWCKQNSAMLAATAAGICVVVGGYYYFANRARQTELASWSTYFNALGRQDSVALETLSNRETNAPQGQMADVLLADSALSSGIELMSTDRAGAEAQLNTAKNRYDRVRKSASDPLLIERATLGVARYYECVGLLEEAISEYEKLLKDFPQGPYADPVRRKIEYLKQPSTQAFVAWYREHKPLPPKPGETPTSLKPADLDKLPTDESSFPPKP